jgi:hypothetical protein
MWAVVLVIGLALWALHARLNLSTNTYTLSRFDCLDFRSHSKDFANDFVSNAKRLVWHSTPATGNGMDIRSTDTAAFVDDINIVFLEIFGSELRESASSMEHRSNIPSSS